MCFHCLLCDLIHYCDGYSTHEGAISFDQVYRHLLDHHPGYLDKLAYASTKGV